MYVSVPASLYHHCAGVRRCVCHLKRTTHCCSLVCRPIVAGAEPTNIWQSPLNFNGTSGLEPSGKSLTISYPASAAGSAFNNGHGSPQIAFTPGDATVSYNGTTYNLLQVHFHSPSEETIEGDAPALDAHFVHASDEGALLVIGVMYDPCEVTSVPLLTTALDNYEGFTSDAPQDVTVPDLSTVIPTDVEFYTFPGSLTTPPCTGGLQWFVASAPQCATEPQIAALKAVGAAAGLDPEIGNARRPTMPLNDRSLTLTKATRAAGDAEAPSTTGSSGIALGLTAIVAAGAAVLI